MRNKVKEEIYIVECEFHCDHLACFLRLYDGWKEDFDESQNYTICEYFSMGDFYFIKKMYVETDEDGEETEGECETVGFLTVDRLIPEKLESLDHIWIMKEERRKGYATLAFEEIKKLKVNYVSDVLTPDGKAFLESLIGEGINKDEEVIHRGFTSKL